MDRQFTPLLLSDDRDTFEVISLLDASEFLLTAWPENRRSRKGYKLAVQAVVRAMAGRIEAEAARLALAMAWETLGKHFVVETRASPGAPERIHEPEY